MRAVVADTGPLNYLVLIGAIEIVPRICETVLIPAAVRDELSQSRAPQLVRDWIAHPPPWLGVQKGKPLVDSALSYLDAGESQAIILASSLPQSLLLMDDREGTIEARRRGLRTLGTLGL